MLPKITNYGRYDSNNYGAHSLMIETDGIDLYYSYETIVAYRDEEDGLVVSENVWSTTTGKHLNWILADKLLRTKNENFNNLLDAAIERHIK